MTSYEDRMERIARLGAQEARDDGIRYTDVRGPVAGGIHVERFLWSMFNVSELHPVQYHLSGLKVKDLYNRYWSYMRTEGLEKHIMTLPDLRAYICGTYGLMHVRVVYEEGGMARSWEEFRIGDRYGRLNTETC